MTTAQVDRTVSLDGDVWKIVGVGVTNDDSQVFCHLCSTTQFTQQRNGAYPRQIGAWLPAELVTGAAA